MRKINQAGIDLIKKWEGFRANAYRDAVGIWTIGYGHTSMAGPPQVRQGMKVSRRKAEQILARDLEKYEKGVQDAIGSAPVTDNEFSAMVSLCYNIGPGAFARSRVARHVRSGHKASAAAAFAAWRRAGGKVLQGLVKRRAEEAALFRTPDRKTGRGGKEAAGGAVVVGGGVAVAVQQGVPWEAIMGVSVLAAAVVAFIIWRKQK